jgi:pSer/pThr/pTyr-binding forkhead associated (FHA) protein
MDAKLVVVAGDTKTTEVKLRLPAILGRGREATLTVPHPLISRQHCEIFERDGFLVVRDLGSLNGTFIGEERVSEAVLHDGELLTIGTVTFRAVYGEDPNLSAPVRTKVTDETDFDSGLEIPPESGPDHATEPSQPPPSSGKERAVAEDLEDLEVLDDQFEEIEEIVEEGSAEGSEEDLTEADEAGEIAPQAAPTTRWRVPQEETPDRSRPIPAEKSTSEQPEASQDQPALHQDDDDELQEFFRNLDE